MTNTKEAAQSSQLTDTPELDTFAARLKFTMKSKGFKRAHIIYSTGATKSAVSKWLSGKTMPKNNIAFALASLLGVSFDWLMLGIGSADDILDSTTQEAIKSLAEKEETFTDRLLFIVRNKGIKPIDIMNATGASKSAVSMWLTGKNVPQKTLGIALAKHLGVSFEWLVLGVDGTKKDPVVSIKPIDLNDSIANRIKTAMYNKDVVQANFHTRLGSTRSGVSKWLKGESKPNDKSIQKIADVLGVSFQWLAYGDDSPVSSTPPPIAVPNKEPCNGVAERIKALMTHKELRATDVASRLNITRDMVSKWLSGDATPSHNHITKLADVLGSSFKWIAYGHLEPNPKHDLAAMIGETTSSPCDNQKPDIRFSTEPATADEYEAVYCKVIYPSHPAIIKAYKDKKDLKVIAKTSASIKVQRTLAERCRASTDHSFCYRNESDSMSPKLLENSLCIADRSRVEVRDGKIYCFRHGVTLKTRYLRRRPDGGLLIVSHNKDYPDEVVPVSELHTVAILGWVYCMRNTEEW